jgi:hypothetical protein
MRRINDPWKNISPAYLAATIDRALIEDHTRKCRRQFRLQKSLFPHCLRLRLVTRRSKRWPTRVFVPIAQPIMTPLSDAEFSAHLGREPEATWDLTHLGRLLHRRGRLQEVTVDAPHWLGCHLR